MGHYGINFNPSYYDTRKYCAPNLLPAALFQESHIFLALVSLVAIADLHENWRKVKFSKTNVNLAQVPKLSQDQDAAKKETS
ncbi:hypothetical protein FOXYSP1_14261 [Fusarium oxysporum f. sp. phaseoli]